MADYIKYEIEVADEGQAEILTAYLSDFPFESFESDERVLCAYIRSDEVEAFTEDIRAILEGLKWCSTEIKSQNWNTLWESNFTEVEVDNEVLIRAPFHTPRPEFGEREIVIQPKMSFGTGHHSTTQLMVRMLLDSKPQSRRVLDMGSGTGVLAILAARLGAESVLAVEIDDMAEESVRENISINGVAERVESICGDVSAIKGRHFDIILANINRNILLHDMADYCATLNAGGLLVISGFLEEDIEPLAQHAQKLGLTRERHLSHEGWQALSLRLNGK